MLQKVLGAIKFLFITQPRSPSLSVICVMGQTPLDVSGQSLSGISLWTEEVGFRHFFS